MIEIPSRYRTGDPDLDGRLAGLLDAVEPRDRALVFEMMVSAMRLAIEEVDRGELKLVSAAVKEFRYAFGVFAPYQGIRKCTVFGSARTRVGDPAYTCAHDFAAAIAARDWMIITGAGPGIMEAGHEGAGADKSFGVNIVLPFEAEANPVIADDPKLINFKYFFTRKVMFMKESHAFVMLPGGFGTMDEAFELLTLIQTGKSTPAPIVLLDPPGGTYWKRWREFVEIELRDGGLIAPDDLALVMVTDSIDAAVDEVTRFYRTYHSIRFVGTRLVLRLDREIDDAELASLNDRFGHVVAEGEIERIGPTEAERRDDDHLALHRLAFRFDRRSWAGVRLMIDALNDADPRVAPDTHRQL